MGIVIPQHPGLSQGLHRAYEGSFILNATIYTHTFFAILTSLIWPLLIIGSLIKFDKPPSPNNFSPYHKAIGRLGMSTMFMTCITAPPLYYFGFWVMA